MTQVQATTDDWKSFRKSLQDRVSPVTWQTWLAPLDLREPVDRELTLVAPSDFHRRWIAEKHLAAIEGAALAVFGPDIEVQLETGTMTLPFDEEPEPEAAEPEPPPRPRPADRKPNRPGSRLLPRYTFEHFVVGQSNRFAHAAAMAIAEQPGTHYNPLFIYGGAGLGKTHLLQAVGHHALELNPLQVVRYVSSENFFNEFIDGIRSKRMDEFKARFRSTDVLLLDDVQFFEGKEQILEEFFHTFNTLYESGKQMMFSSDRHPRHLDTLEDRLRSRFEWGLLTDIQPPDVETRLAILRMNLESLRQPVPEDVLLFIAESVENNIRELEGAMTRVTAFAGLTGQLVNLEMAQDVLQDLVPSSTPRPLTADQIMDRAAAAFGFSAVDLRAKSRRQPLVLSRQVAMYLCRELTDLSLPQIGNLFNRDHSTVLHAVDKVKGLLQTDHAVFERVTALSQELRTT
ncbi:MAG: chromosomal replication initiator protein DnaA [Acidimicrobiia bacterium]|nr:chromosomal replication initiator protein DnaA [Acidimicrobiia bacterium]